MQKFLSTGVPILIVLAGLAAIGFWAINWLFIALLVSIFSLLLLGVALFIASPEISEPALYTLIVLLVLAAIAGMGFFPILVPIVTGVAGIVLIVAILFARQNVNGYLLGDKWHLIDKGLGGSIFGDLANMVGVFAGIGAYRLVTGNAMLVKAWWWVGQMAAYLAAAVSISLLWRWVHSAPDSGESKQKWPALLNWMVAAGTIVSLYAPTDSNRSIAGLTEPGASGAVAGKLWLFLLFVPLVVLCLMLFVKFKRFWEDGQARLVTLAFIAIAIASGVTVGFAVYGAQNSQDWTTAGTVIGILAVFAWISGEFINFANVTASWRSNNTFISVLDYLDWEKNLWEVIGGVGTIFFLIGGLLIAGRPEQFGSDHFIGLNDTMFVIAASVGLLGTLRGILRGILKKAYPRDTGTKQELELLRIQAPEAQQDLRSAAQVLAQVQHMVQVRDGQIRQLQNQVADLTNQVTALRKNFNYTLVQKEDLQRQVADKSREITALQERISKPARK